LLICAHSFSWFSIVYLKWVFQSGNLSALFGFFYLIGYLLHCMESSYCIYIFKILFAFLWSHWNRKNINTIHNGCIKSLSNKLYTQQCMLMELLLLLFLSETQTEYGQFYLLIINILNILLLKFKCMFLDPHWFTIEVVGVVVWSKALCFLTFFCNYFPRVSVYKLSWELLFDAF